MRDEELLIQKAREGDAEAFGRLYDTYLPKIFRFVLLRTRNRQDAEDLSQQVFINAWQNVERFEFRGFPFSSWLYRIASNAVIDYYRTSKATQDIETIPEEFVATASSLEKELDQAFSLASVRTALAKLDPDHQNVIIMRFVDDLSTKEIAQALEKSEGAVRVIQHRALKTLKSHLDGTTQKTTQEA